MKTRIAVLSALLFSGVAHSQALPVIQGPATLNAGNVLNLNSSNITLQQSGTLSLRSGTAPISAPTAPVQLMSGQIQLQNNSGLSTQSLAPAMLPTASPMPSSPIPALNLGLPGVNQALQLPGGAAFPAVNLLPVASGVYVQPLTIAPSATQAVQLPDGGILFR